MPIGQLLEHHAFSPEDVKVLVGAYADTLRALNLADRDDQLKMTVAKLIIEFAGEGELDPTRLRDLVVKALRLNKQVALRYCACAKPRLLEAATSATRLPRSRAAVSSFSSMAGRVRSARRRLHKY